MFPQADRIPMKDESVVQVERDSEAELMKMTDDRKSDPGKQPRGSGKSKRKNGPLEVTAQMSKPQESPMVWMDRDMEVGV